MNIVQSVDGELTYFDLKVFFHFLLVLRAQVIHRPRRTGFEEHRNFPIKMRDIIAGRYEVNGFLGSAAFSRAVQCVDRKTGTMVCIKIIKNNKDFFDQCLDEVKLLKYIQDHGDPDAYNVIRMFGAAFISFIFFYSDCFRLFLLQRTSFHRL